MKRGGGSSKGSGFERQICKDLSLWWTDGERDDVFWRTPGSGARATVRSKGGLATYGQYGDVAATDPIGEPLLKFATIEIKRGYNRATPFDLLDALESAGKQIFQGFLEQAQEQMVEANSYAFWLITKRDRREPIITMPAYAYYQMTEYAGDYSDKFASPLVLGFDTGIIRSKGAKDSSVTFYSYPLKSFLVWLDPETIRKSIDDFYS